MLYFDLFAIFSFKLFVNHKKRLSPTGKVKKLWWQIENDRYQTIVGRSSVKGRICTGRKWREEEEDEEEEEEEKEEEEE